MQGVGMPGHGINLFVLLEPIKMPFSGSCWPEWADCVERHAIPVDQREIQIPPTCLPPASSAVTVKVSVKSPEEDAKHDEQCLYVTAKQDLHPQIRCALF